MTEPCEVDPAADPPDAVASTPAVSPNRGGRLPTMLVVVATCVAVLSALTTWVKTEALDTEQWVSRSDELLADPEVRAALSVYLTDQLFSVVDVGAEFESLLPDDLDGLAGPLAGALRGPAGQAVDQVLASQRFADLWQSANRATHERIVAILRSESSALVSVDGGEVTLELGVILRSLGESLGLPEAALDRIPPDAGQIVIVQSDQLASAQSAVRLLEFLSWSLFVVVAAMYALAVYLARDRRERMLAYVGVAMVVGGVAVLAMRSIGVRLVVDAIGESASQRSIGAIVGEVATGLLRQLAWGGITLGVLIALFATLLGGHRWAVATRRALAGLAASTGSMVGVAIALLLGLLWWSPGRAFDRWPTAITLVALVIGAVVALTTRIRAEHEHEHATAGPEP